MENLEGLNLKSESLMDNVVISPFPQGQRFEQQIFYGNELDEEVKEFLWGFDSEVQSSKLTEDTIVYLHNLIELIFKYADARKNYPKYESFFTKKIQEINIMFKTFIRLLRAHGGFTMVMAKTNFLEQNQRIEEMTNKQAQQGFFKNLMNEEINL